MSPCYADEPNEQSSRPHRARCAAVTQVRSCPSGAACRDESEVSSKDDRRSSRSGPQSAAFLRCSSLYAARRRACSIGAPAATASRMVPIEAL